MMRGADDPTRSRSFTGLFGRMFRNLPPAELKEKHLMDLGADMISEKSSVPEGRDDPRDSKTPAGYTYLGQFIAHDITFDPASSLQRDSDPEALEDYRTPRFDLDSIYGRGPADQPYLYTDDVHLALGRLLDNKKDHDVPRVPSTHRAIIGDPRNDENVLISQLHAMFLRFHNQLADRRKADDKKADFTTVQRLVRWHYQWVALYDFLPTIVDKDTYLDVLPHLAENKRNLITHPPKLRFYRARENAFMPIEFSAAAYRFGHSTVRRSYRVNTDEKSGGPFLIFFAENPALGLGGSQPFNAGWAVDWTLFFEPKSAKEADRRVQRARKISTSLADPLANLPFKFAKEMPSLAQRNLIRGKRLNLPSGQAVARAIGANVVPDKELTVGPKFRPLLDVSGEFADNAPLWYYVLAEAQALGGERLGPVGSRIVMETFVGLMMRDGHSFLRQDPLWSPEGGHDFDMAEFIRRAIGQ
jgi:Animal haem peroxidase